MSVFDFRDPVSAWTHCLWMVLAIPGTVLLWNRSHGSRSKQAGMVIFGLTLILCFTASTLYHAARDAALVRLFHTLDHIGIYLLIAGTYTPASLVLLRGRWRWGVLCMAWSMAGAGILLRLLAEDLPGSVSTGYYLAMGWGAILCLFELARHLPHRALFPIVLGGVLYSIGAVINLAGWPVAVPGVVGPHELFHLFVMAGSFTHFWFALRFVAPYKRPRARTAALPAVSTLGTPLAAGSE